MLSLVSERTILLPWTMSFLQDSTTFLAKNRCILCEYWSCFAWIIDCPSVHSWRACQLAQLFGIYLLIGVQMRCSNLSNHKPWDQIVAVLLHDLLFSEANHGAFGGKTLWEEEWVPVWDNRKGVKSGKLASLCDHLRFYEILRYCTWSWGSPARPTNESSPQCSLLKVGGTLELKT